MHKFTLNLMD